MLDLNQNEKRILHFFRLYCLSYNANYVNKTYFLSNCYFDWEERDWTSAHGRSVNGYDKIDDLIHKIVSEEDYFLNMFTDCEGSQRIEIGVDCDERELSITLFETIFGQEPHFLTYNLDEIQEEFGDETHDSVVRLFDMLNGVDGRVDFSGGGDDGYIDDFIVVGDQEITLSDEINDMLFSILSNNFSGWEINEGSNGNFVFDTDKNWILFDFNYNTEEESLVGDIIKIKF